MDGTTFDFIATRFRTWEGADFEITEQVDLDDQTALMAPKDISLATTVMEFRLRTGGKVYLALTIGDGLEAVSLKDGSFRVPPMEFTIEAGRYIFEVIHTWPDGSSKAYIKGTATILEGNDG